MHNDDEEKGLAAYGNREARLKFFLGEKNSPLFEATRRRDARLLATEKKNKRKGRRQLAGMIIDKLNVMSEAEKVSYLTSLPTDYPFNHIPSRYLPELFRKMRNSWFNPKKRRR